MLHSYVERVSFLLDHIHATLDTVIIRSHRQETLLKFTLRACSHEVKGNMCRSAPLCIDSVYRD